MTDDVSMIFFTVDPDVTECFYRAPRRTRQMFFYKDSCLYQSRLYPQGSDEITEQNRSLVHKIFAACLGVPNLWILKTKRNELDCCITGEDSAQYADYDYYGNLSFLKGTPKIAKLVIGMKPICVCCGLPFVSSHAGIKCDCQELVVCQDCGRTMPKRQTRYVENAYHCNACLHICGSCGRAVHDTMYPAYDRRGRLIEVCGECYNTSRQPCFACSVRNICAIVGSTLCYQASIHPAETEVTQ